MLQGEIEDRERQCFKACISSQCLLGVAGDLNAVWYYGSAECGDCVYSCSVWYLGSAECGDCVYSCSVWYCMVAALTQGGGLVVSKG